MEYEAGLLINQTKNTVVCAVNPHKRIYPASMTKILTALVVMEAVEKGQISLTDTVVIQKKIEFNEDNVTVLGLEPGDYITVDELLHGLLISSYNDCAVALARYVSGSVSAFVELMNQKAAELGATNSHFVNPHGLTDDNHYTTVYDMYLIMNEAIKFEVFREIIHMDSYTTVYHDKNGAEKEITVNSTNYYFIGKADPPSGITILGGKTGTTDAAGHCLVLLSRDTQNKPYISVIMRSDARENLYISMSELLAQIGN